MKLIIKKSDYENAAKAPFVKRNLVEVCKWFNFIEDDMHVQFQDERITSRISLDYFIGNPDIYEKWYGHTLSDAAHKRFVGLLLSYGIN